MGHCGEVDPYRAELAERQREHTLVILKPDCLERNLHWALLRRIEERCGVKPTALAMLRLNRYDVYSLYSHQEHQDFWFDMLDYLRRGSVIVVIFQGEGAIEKVRTEVGHYDKSQSYYVSPGGQATIRTAHGDKKHPNHVNLIHSSSSKIEYERECRWLRGKLKELA